MPGPTKACQPAQGSGRTDSDESECPSTNLWVGNLSPDVSDVELLELFARHGAVDRVSTYSSRSFAFVCFKRVEDAKAAKQALQGAAVRGNSIKIEFARPAKPCRSLWVGGFSPGLSKEELEELFLKFGKIEDFRFLRDRNTAFVVYFRLEDATEAMKNMNGKHIGGNQIRVDFLRSQPNKREQLGDATDGQFQGRNTAALDFYAGQERPLPHSQLQMSRKGDSQPSNILWIGYPPSVQIDEHMLHNAMILFGEIEGIKSFPSRHCSFVEFRSVDEARRAKEGLQGRLFNDRRIAILFATSDLTPGKDYPTFYPGNKGVRPEMLLNEPQFLPVQIDGFGHNRPTASNNLAGQLPPGGILGPNASSRALGPQGGIDPLISGTELNNDLIAAQKGQDGKMGPNWRKLSPLPGIFPSTLPGTVAPSRSATSGSWGVLDMNQLHRDPKRLRIDGTLHIEDHGKLMEYGGISPVGARITSRVPSPSPRDNDFIWRGIIAKGGTPVCRARCIPIGKGIGNDLPKVVNCSARTGLDLLAKHYADAIGFEIVFFLPDSEDDFASYTEFLHYLGAKNRAGVAKFDDGTTLFLVPPSEFLTRVLKVPGPERLYGVVLKFPPTSDTSVQQSPQVPYSDRQQLAPHQGDSHVLPTKEEHLLPDYNRVHDDSKLPPKSFYTPVTVSQSSPQGYSSISNVSTSQPALNLTPDLIATLTSFLPANGQYSGLEGGKAALSSSAVRPLVTSGDGSQLQLWKTDKPTPQYSGHSSEQLGSMYNTQPNQYQPHPSVSSTIGHPSQVLHGSSQISDSAMSLPQQVAVSPLPLTNYVDPSQSGQVCNPTQVGQQQLSSMQRGYGVVQGIDSSGFYNAQVPSQPNVVGSSNLTHGTTFSQASSVAPFVADNPMQHLQSAVTGAGQGTQDAEADKNQRYQSTLQFAADLLLKIQQHKTQGGQGLGNLQ